MNLNAKQVLSIAVAVLGVLMISTTNLTDLFGAQNAKIIVSTASLLNATIGAILAVISGQGSLVKDVLAMPGVEKIEVNAKANTTLATIAVDPKEDKISPTLEAQAAVEAKAKGE